LLLPARHLLNIGLLGASFLPLVPFLMDSTYNTGLACLGSTAAFSAIMVSGKVVVVQD